MGAAPGNVRRLPEKSSGAVSLPPAPHCVSKPTGSSSRPSSRYRTTWSNSSWKRSCRFLVSPSTSCMPTGRTRRILRSSSLRTVIASSRRCLLSSHQGTSGKHEQPRQIFGGARGIFLSRRSRHPTRLCVPRPERQAYRADPVTPQPGSTDLQPLGGRVGSSTWTSRLLSITQRLVALAHTQCAVGADQQAAPWATSSASSISCPSTQSTFDTRVPGACVRRQWWQYFPVCTARGIPPRGH